MYEIDKIQYLQIGVQGENIARKIQIDMTSWVDELEADNVSGYSFSLVFRPYNDPNKYPMVTTYDAETRVLTWRVASEATQTPGVGYTEIRAQEATSGLVKKTRIIPTSVEESVSGNETTPPEVQAGWVTQVLNSAAAVLASSQGKQIRFTIDTDTGHLMFSYSDDEEVTEETEWTDVDLGPVNAYAMAVLDGYTGTAEQFAQYMADIANGAASASASATSAAASAADALEHTQSVIETWLGNNITPGSQYALDRTLALQNAAAPADLVGELKCELKNFPEAIPGFMDISGVEMTEGSYISNFNTGVISTNSLYMLSDYIELPKRLCTITVNRVIYGTDGTRYEKSNVVAIFDENKNIIPNGKIMVSDGDLSHVTVTDISAKYVRINFSRYMVAPFVRIDDYTENKTVGFVGSYTGTFTGYRQVINTFIPIKAGTPYFVRFNKPRSELINVYRSGATSNFKRVEPWMNEVVFTNGPNAGTLYVYNPNQTGAYDNIDVSVFEIDSIQKKADTVPRVYKISKESKNSDYTSVTQCFLDLKDDSNPKIIEIWEGDYDIYQEYVDANVPVYTGDNPSLEYFDYCVWVPENTHVIGKGIVRLKWMPDPTADSITPNQCKCVSPLNVAASCTIENIEVYCKNGRYCLHNDGLGKGRYIGATQKYINCRFYKYENDRDSESNLTYGFLPTTGFGIDRAMHHVYENCAFYNYANERAFYGHNRNTVYGSALENNQNSDITLVNCVIVSEGTPCVKLGNGASNTALQIRTMFNSWYISGLIRSTNESSSSQTIYHNSFDLQFLNCGNVSLKIDDQNNMFEPKAYNTNLTLT